MELQYALRKLRRTSGHLLDTQDLEWKKLLDAQNAQTQKVPVGDLVEDAKEAAPKAMPSKKAPAKTTSEEAEPKPRPSRAKKAPAKAPSEEAAPKTRPPRVRKAPAKAPSKEEAPPKTRPSRAKKPPAKPPLKEAPSQVPPAEKATTACGKEPVAPNAPFRPVKPKAPPKTKAPRTRTARLVDGVLQPDTNFPKGLPPCPKFARRPDTTKGTQMPSPCGGIPIFIYIGS